LSVVGVSVVSFLAASFDAGKVGSAKLPAIFVVI
jgi:hypothetical protein